MASYCSCTTTVLSLLLRMTGTHPSCFQGLTMNATGWLMEWAGPLHLNSQLTQITTATGTLMRWASSQPRWQVGPTMADADWWVCGVGLWWGWLWGLAFTVVGILVCRSWPLVTGHCFGGVPGLHRVGFLVPGDGGMPRRGFGAFQGCLKSAGKARHHLGGALGPPTSPWMAGYKLGLVLGFWAECRGMGHHLGSNFSVHSTSQAVGLGGLSEEQWGEGNC